MSNLLALLVASLLLLMGEATSYRQGLMDEVYTNRIEMGHVRPCPFCIGKIAVTDFKHVGKLAFLKRSGRPLEGPFLITDCGSFITEGRILEVDYETAQRWIADGDILPLKNVGLIILQN